MTESVSPEFAPPRARRTWLYVVTAGCALVVLTLVISALVIFDKQHFGWMAGSRFLGTIAGAIFLGAILVIIGTWNLPARRNWRGIVLFGWALIALISPMFGYLFLLPFGALAVLLPVVIAILITLFRRG